MKKQFKLIKWYPSLPTNWEVGDIVIKDKAYPWYYTKEKDLANPHKHLEGNMAVENNPEFWEEVEEKDYEILSLRNELSHEIWEGYKHDLEKKSKNSIYSIWSVKRLIDGEIFTVGDKICNTTSLKEKKYGYVTIKAFELYHSLKIHIDTGFIADYSSLFDNFTHYKKSVLFTTEDGIDMFEGDTYYALDPKIYDIVWSVADENSLDSDWLKFSTKAKAERWVLENKPKYSLSQIKKALEDSILTVNKPSGHIYIDKQYVFKKLMEE